MWLASGIFLPIYFCAREFTDLLQLQTKSKSKILSVISLKLGGTVADTSQEYIRDNADHQRSSHVFGPMVHELFNEDLGILPPQLKGPYGLEQLLATTADRMWRSQLRAIVTVAPLYGSYTIKCSENMQNTQILKSKHHQTLLFNSYFLSWALQTASCVNTGMD